MRVVALTFVPEVRTFFVSNKASGDYHRARGITSEPVLRCPSSADESPLHFLSPPEGFGGVLYVCLFARMSVVRYQVRLRRCGGEKCLTRSHMAHGCFLPGCHVHTLGTASS